jgi:hypothetical protein
MPREHPGTPSPVGRGEGEGPTGSGSIRTQSWSSLERPGDATVGRRAPVRFRLPSRAPPCRCRPCGSVDQAVHAPGRVRGRPADPQGAWLRAGHRGRKAGRRSGRVDRRPDLRRPDPRGLVGTGRGGASCCRRTARAQEPGDAVAGGVRASVGDRCATGCCRTNRRSRAGPPHPPDRLGRSRCSGRFGRFRPTLPTRPPSNRTSAKQAATESDSGRVLGSVAARKPALARCRTRPRGPMSAEMSDSVGSCSADVRFSGVLLTRGGASPRDASCCAAALLSCPALAWTSLPKERRPVARPGRCPSTSPARTQLGPPRAGTGRR